MKKYLLISILWVFSLDAVGSNKCNLEIDGMSIFLEKKEGLEKRYNDSGHDLIIEYCLDSRGSKEFKKKFTSKNKDYGVKAIINSVKIVGEFLRGKDKVSNKDVIRYVLNHYKEEYKKTNNEKEKKRLRNSFVMTSNATVEIMNYYLRKKEG